MSALRIGTAVLAAVVLVAGGPYDVTLLPTTVAPEARGTARLISAESPFGIAVSADGHARYDLILRVAGLPAPATLGAYRTYVAWAATPDLRQWVRLGVVQNGTSTVGTASFNKFLLVISAEPDSLPPTHDGPIVLHGTSPSGWLQSFLAHPIFRGAGK